MKRFMSLVLAASLAVALGCGQSKPKATADGGPGPGGTGGAGGQAGTGGAGGQPGDAGADAGLTLVNWVDDLTKNHNNEIDLPDSVEDKAGTIIDTDDPAAFDSLLSKQAP